MAHQNYYKVFLVRKNPCRAVYGVASLPLGVPVEVEIVFEVVPISPLRPKEWYGKIER